MCLGRIIIRAERSESLKNKTCSRTGGSERNNPVLAKVDAKEDKSVSHDLEEKVVLLVDEAGFWT